MKGSRVFEFLLKRCLEGDGWQDTSYSRDILSAKTFISSYAL